MLHRDEVCTLTLTERKNAAPVTKSSAPAMTSTSTPQDAQSAADATKSALQGSQSAAQATNSVFQGLQSAAPAMHFEFKVHKVQRGLKWRFAATPISCACHEK